MNLKQFSLVVFAIPLTFFLIISTWFTGDYFDHLLKYIPIFKTSDQTIQEVNLRKKLFKIRKLVWTAFFCCSRGNILFPLQFLFSSIRPIVLSLTRKEIVDKKDKVNHFPWFFLSTNCFRSNDKAQHNLWPLTGIFPMV